MRITRRAFFSALLASPLVRFFRGGTAPVIVSSADLGGADLYLYTAPMVEHVVWPKLSSTPLGEMPALGCAAPSCDIVSHPESESTACGICNPQQLDPEFVREFCDLSNVPSEPVELTQEMYDDAVLGVMRRTIGGGKWR